VRRRVYLSGGIEHSADGGKSWRREIGRFLVEELGEEVYDPAADQKKDLTEEEQSGFRRWKSEDPERFRGVVRKIIARDLRKIESESDYVLAFWDESASRGGGTAAEITLAYRLGKPVYVVLGMPRKAASGWILAAASAVFDSFDDLKGFLLKEARNAGARR
jgi:nucleoside 2-deoxyribosyltransferase